MKKTLILFGFSVLILIQISCIESDHKLKDGKIPISNIAVERTPPVVRLPDKKDTLTYEVNLDNLPIKIMGEFKNENQKLILVLKNGRKRNVSVQVVPDSDSVNIRINNILLNNKSIDGPFGKQVDYVINQDYSIVIGKSLMAGESQKGKFSVTLK